MKVKIKNLEKFWKIMHPRNVVIVGSGQYGKDANFMACGWNTPIAEDVPSCGIVVDKKTYTFELIEKYKEFSINILPFEKIDLIFFLGSVSGREVNKIEKANLKVKKGEKTNVPIIEDCLAFAECKVINYVDVGEVRFYIGKVLNAEYEKDLYDERFGFDLKKVKIPFHIKGNFFTTNGIIKESK
ncbi:MAG: flavin reductase family protein [Candidatus Aenigmatarchaeota archaeon]